MKKEASQIFFMETCDEIAKIECKKKVCEKDLMLRADSKPLCVMRELLDFYRLDSGKAEATVVPEADFDANYKKFIKGEGAWNAYYSQLPEAKPYFDKFWAGILTSPNTPAALKALYTNVPKRDFTVLDNAMIPDEAKVPLLELREKLLKMLQDKYQQVIGRNEQFDKVYEWSMIEFRSSVATPMANADAHDAYDVMEDFVAKRRELAPEGMKTMFQTDTLVPALGWTWMLIEDALVSNLMTGFAICFPVAFVVLMAATGNVIVASYAILAIAFIVGGVLGAARLYAGWDLGVAESIAGVIVIGFSVDYTVHLGHIYKDATMHASKELKTQHALTVMGTTVIGGGMTTLSAGLILYLCTLTFFTKMASLLVWTIILSIVYSLFFFTSLCAVFGPTGEFGSVYTLCGLIKPKTA